MVDNFLAREDSGKSGARSSWRPNSNDALRILKEHTERRECDIPRVAVGPDVLSESALRIIIWDRPRFQNVGWVQRSETHQSANRHRLPDCRGGVRRVTGPG